VDVNLPAFRYAFRLALYHYCPRQFKKKPCTALVIVLFFNTKSLIMVNTMLRLVVLTACIFFISVSSARADFYRWMDKDGREFFTNDPKQIPQKYRESASIIKPDESRVSVGEPPVVPEISSAKSIDHKDQ